MAAIYCYFMVQKNHLFAKALIQPYFKKEYNATTDNVSVSFKLRDKLIPEKMMLCGSVSNQTMKLTSTKCLKLLLSKWLYLSAVDLQL